MASLYKKSSGLTPPGRLASGSGAPAAGAAAGAAASPASAAAGVVAVVAILSLACCGHDVGVPRVRSEKRKQKMKNTDNTDGSELGTIRNHFSFFCIAVLIFITFLNLEMCQLL